MYVYDEWMEVLLKSKNKKGLEYAIRIKIESSTIHRSLIDNIFLN